MLTVTPNPLVQGGTAVVCVSGSSHTSETITVNIDDGEGHTSSVQIVLDAQGAGCADWTVPNWEQALFNYGNCDEVGLSIVLPTGG